MMSLRGLRSVLAPLAAVGLCACASFGGDAPNGASRERGDGLATFTALVLRPDPSAEFTDAERRELAAKQLEWLDALAYARLLVAAGPLSSEWVIPEVGPVPLEATPPRPQTMERGLLVLDLEDEADVDEVLGGNEAVQAGLFLVGRFKVEGPDSLRRVPYLDAGRRQALPESLRADRGATTSIYVVALANRPDVRPAEELDPAQAPWRGRTDDGREVVILWTRFWREARDLLGDGFSMFQWEASRAIGDLVPEPRRSGEPTEGS